MGLNKPGSGTLPTNTPHNDLINRTAVDSHPMSAITGLVSDLSAKATAITTATNTANSASTTAGTADTKATQAETKADTAISRIGTLTNLQTSNKTDLVQALNENFTNANNGKSAIATAVNGKGGTANASMTFSQLASAVTGIPNIDEATGDAVASNVLAGKTFSNDVGNGIVGTMPDRAGVNSSTQNSIVGTTLRFRPPTGYYDGVDDLVSVTDADFIAGNIKSGVDLFGLVGTLVDGTGKKSYASGVIASSGGTLQYSYIDSSGNPNYPYTTISPGFVPRIIKIRNGSNGNITIFQSGIYNRNPGWILTSGDGNYDPTGVYELLNGGNGLVGLTTNCPVQNGGINQYWEAWE